MCSETMNERCKNQTEFKKLFYKINGEPPYSIFYPIEFKGNTFIPSISNNKDFVKIRYVSTNSGYNYIYDVYIEKGEYVKAKKSK